MARPTSTKPAATAKHIVEAARDMFLAEGYEAASMDAIARQADVSKATLYAHFASKDSLFTAVMQDQWQGYVAELEQIASDRKGSLAEQLTRAGINFLTYLLSDAKIRMFRVIFSEGGRIPEICQNFIQTSRAHSYTQIATILHNGAAPERFTMQECEDAARLFIAMLRGDLLWNRLLDFQKSPKETEIAAHVASAVQLMVKHFSPQKP